MASLRQGMASSIIMQRRIPYYPMSRWFVGTRSVSSRMRSSTATTTRQGAAAIRDTIITSSSTKSGVGSLSLLSSFRMRWMSSMAARIVQCDGISNNNNINNNNNLSGITRKTSLSSSQWRLTERFPSRNSFLHQHQQVRFASKKVRNEKTGNQTSFCIEVPYIYVIYLYRTYKTCS